LHAETGFLRAIIKTPKNRLEERRIRQKADEVLDFVGLSDRKNTLAKNLTQEAQKRLSIAIAIATDPKLLLLDEPTGGVNLDEIEALMRLMEKIRKDGITICLIEHKMRVVMSISDRIVALSYGEKVAEGRPQEVASNPKVIKAYLGERYASRSDMRFTSS
jgi:ABC-type branched-subunit amino acid transport system ATPase component